MTESEVKKTKTKTDNMVKGYTSYPGDVKMFPENNQL